MVQIVWRELSDRVELDLQGLQQVLQKHVCRGLGKKQRLEGKYT
jgi:hypothetical protein